MITIHIEPFPIPVKLVAERMGETVESLILKHLRGELPLFKIGRKWYANPLSLLELGRNEPLSAVSFEPQRPRAKPVSNHPLDRPIVERRRTRPRTILD
jgi:hypothetical protein